MDLKLPSQDIELQEFFFEYGTIWGMSDPSKEEQIAVANRYPYGLSYVDNPCEEAIEIATEKNPHLIHVFPSAPAKLRERLAMEAKERRESEERYARAMYQARLKNLSNYSQNLSNFSNTLQSSFESWDSFGYGGGGGSYSIGSAGSSAGGLAGQQNSSTSQVGGINDDRRKESVSFEEAEREARERKVRRQGTWWTSAQEFWNSRKESESK